MVIYFNISIRIRILVGIDQIDLLSENCFGESDGILWIRYDGR